MSPDPGATHRIAFPNLVPPMTGVRNVDPLPVAPTSM
jgi:hypothetical protein